MTVDGINRGIALVTPERWQQIDRLFHSALERPREERAGFLAEACGDDKAVRGEVEALIAAHERSGEFLDAPAYEVADAKLANDPAQPAVGQTLNHYKILGTLGVGGMGEVYVAQDNRLGRKIGLKLLPEEFTKDADRVRRFEQEARAASALSHPNVCVIYEIGETEDGHQFIAMECIEGMTLRQRLAQKRMRLVEALDIATQIAAGLAVAHATGIVHRDIKPENIMLRADGLVKVLDFGLAKLTERQTNSTDTEALMRSLVQTGSGMIIGTVAYMSPEQARGLAVDGRTDIWSLGVVLYEMVAGQPPFTGPTPSDLLVSILEREPPPLTFHKREVPAELEWIVRKALRKDREERYQVVKDLALDLKSLRHDLEVEVELERSAPPASSDIATAATDSGQTSLATAVRRSATRTGRATEAKPTTSAEYIVSEIRRHKRGVILVLASLLLATVAAGFGLYKLLSRSKAPTPFQNATITRLTTTGNATEAAISRDGKYVAYVIDDNGKQSLWVRQVATENSLQLIPPTEIDYGRLTFSRDGTQIYYVVVSVLYQVSVLGGTPKKVMDEVEDFTFSPDGKRIAFVPNSDSALMIADVDGSEMKKVVSRQAPESIGAPSWSPDGRVIAFVSGGITSSRNLFELNVEEKKERKISSQSWLEVSQMDWLSDGSGIVVTAMVPSSPFFQIWRVAYPNGEARRLISDLNQYDGLSAAADSSTLVTVQRKEVSNVWVSSLADPNRSKQITFGAGRYEDLSWTPNGKIVYASDASGHADIWMIEADGSGQKQLTNDPGRSYGPTETPDGRYIVFHSDRTGAWNIWRANADGSNPKRLANGEWANCSPGGRWVVYRADLALWKIPIEGGNPVRISEKNTLSWAPVVSPRGDFIAYKRGSYALSGPVTIIPFEGGQPVRTFSLPLTSIAGPAYRWAPDGRALVYSNTNNGVSNLWLQPLDGGEPKRLTNFKSEWLNSFDISRDGKIAIERGVTTRDVVLISGIN